MKSLFFTIISLVLLSQGVAQATSLWKSEEEKKIYFVPNPILKISVQEIAADQNNWYLLGIDLSYPYEHTKSQIKRIKNDYPTYEVQKVIFENSTDYFLQIPDLGISDKVKPKPGVDGPYIGLTYFLPKSAGIKLKKGLENIDDFLNLSGSLTANVPTLQILESVEVPKNICRDLFSGNEEETVFSIVKNFSLVSKQIESLSKYEKNQEILKKEILRSCVELDRMKAQSFSDLLQASVHMLYPTTDFKVVLKHTVLERKEFFLTADKTIHEEL
ncbi:MAG: hypothetical protein M9962_07555 [Oligoflexia bacterium]|nr:hypothetical protein [Oligoflexia bacterium]